MANSAIEFFTFHDGTTTVSNGNLMDVEQLSNIMNVFFKTTGTFTVIFEGQIEYQGDFYPVPAVNLSSMTFGTTASDATGIYQIDLSGWSYIRCRVSAITGSLTCKSKVVS